MSARRTLLLHGGTCRSDGNMGDALMLRAVVDRVGGLLPEARLTVKPEAGAYAERARWGFHQLLWARDWTRLSGTFGRYFLHRYRDTFGIVDDSELDAVIDFMGFRYGDVGKAETALAAVETERWRRAGAKIVFLPQAFGPFGSEQIRQHMRRVLANADLVFARDGESEGHLRKLGVGGERIARAPDFTIPLKPSSAPAARDVVCIVPNRWMVERTSREVSERYVSFLARASQQCRACGVSPEIVLHARFQDDVVAERICREIGDDVATICESDAMRLKARLGGARLVIGSRYHGLIGALSQGVPAIGTSWSHKYAGLYQDFEAPELLLNPAEGSGKLDHVIADVLRDPTAMRARLLAAAERLSSEVERMWDRVSDVLLAG